MAVACNCLYVEQKKPNTPPENRTSDAQITSSLMASHHMSTYGPERLTPRGPYPVGHDPTPALSQLSAYARPHIGKLCLDAVADWLERSCPAMGGVWYCMGVNLWLVSKEWESYVLSCDWSAQNENCFVSTDWPYRNENWICGLVIGQLRMITVFVIFWLVISEWELCLLPSD